MKPLITVLILCLFISSALFGQDYVVDYPFGNGYTRVYQKLPAGSAQQKEAEKTYGVIDSKNNLVIPLQYKSISLSGENGVFIISNKVGDKGLFSVIAQKVIAEPQFADIYGFSEGLATVKKRKPGTGAFWGAVDVNGTIAIPIEYDYLGVLKEGLINFQKDGKTGFLDKNNNIVIPAMYLNFSGFNDGLAHVKIAETGKYGYIDKTNKLVIAAEYEDANPFFKGYTSVAKKKSYTTGSAGKGSVTVPGQWVVIDKTGKIIQERSFDRVSPLQAGDLFIIESNNKKGTMNTKGMPILPMEYSEVTIDNAGYAIFKTIETKKYGMMNNVGNLIVATNYDYVSHTTANRFYVLQNGKYTVGDVNNNIFIQPDSANGVILGKKRIVYHYSDKVKIFDLNGNLQKTITDLNLKNFGHSLSVTEDSIKLNTDNTVHIINLVNNTKKLLPFGEAGDYNEEGIFVVKKKGYDFYDYTGKKLNTTSYYSVKEFSEGICALQDNSTANPYLADKNFKKIKVLASNFQGPYSEGLAYANNTQLGKIYYLDKTGNEVISLSAKEGTRCVGGIIAVKDNYNKYYLINKTGKQVNEKKWDEIGTFSDGLALVKDNSKWGFIDAQGNKVIDTKYDIASSFTKGAAIVKLNNKFFLINKKGEPVNDNKYDAAGTPDNGTFPVQKDNMTGLIDSKGNVLIDFKQSYKSLLYMSDDRVWASKDGKWGLLDKTGKALTEFIYDGANFFKNGYAVVKQNETYGLINKAGKFIVPAEYKSLGSVYKNTILGIKPAETVFFSLK